MKSDSATSLVLEVIASKSLLIAQSAPSERKAGGVIQWVPLREQTLREDRM